MTMNINILYVSTFPYKNYRFIKYLLKNKKINVNECNIDGKNALMFVCMNKSDNFKALKLLIHQGIKINTRDTLGKTALYYAVLNNNIK